ncbi:blue copper protein-like [Macadamia integrifolia]|uniref:blue copper protein-like n=1 Tax=Macadamia integrifolia TaxID=60698 RepID=UPI001C4E82AB|nr:blue copper protein-like [Macadamia integrifolia]
MESNTVAGVLITILTLCAVAPSLATSYTVGDTAGWTTNVDYSTWTKGKTFAVGDTLVFNYPGGHTVDEVSGTDYSSCALGNSISTDSSGSTKITLKTTGPHYYICGITGHCASGMKLAVTVTGAASTTPSTGTTPTTTTPATTTPTTTSPSTTTSSTINSSPATLSPTIAILFSCLAVFKLILSPLA